MIRQTEIVDIAIVGAGPVGLMCAYLGELCGLSTVVLDRTSGPLPKGRADAMNARTLQLLEIADLFDDLYTLGKICNTSSVFANGKFVSRQSKWWDALEGCFHKHFLMLGQPYIEKLLDERLSALGAPVRRKTEVATIELKEAGCVTTLASGETIRSRYIIGADGSRSLVRSLFKVPFEITRPQIIWAVIDGVIETDFPKVPEIIVFQNETSDVAWIPREGDIDRFYIRMDRRDFTFEEAMERINRATAPHQVRFKEVTWFSNFSVKESVAESFSIGDRVFLAGDSAHIHSVNGGMGLNTGLGDAFNLMWKLHHVLRYGAPVDLLRTYEGERKPVAMSVVGTSGELVRSTKYSDGGSHAENYVDIVERRAGNITGMGVRYGSEGLVGTRLHDFAVEWNGKKTRIYSLLDYTKFSLLVFGDGAIPECLPEYIQVLRFAQETDSPYRDCTVLVRPDTYLEKVSLSNRA